MDNLFKVMSLAACFRTAQRMDNRYGVGVIVEGAKELYCLRGGVVPVEITNQGEESILRDAMMEVGGATARNPQLANTIVELVMRRADELFERSHRMGLIASNLYAYTLKM